MSNDFEVGFDLIQKGDFAGAAAALERAVASDPSNNRVKAMLGVAQAGAGDSAKGEETLRASLHAANGDPVIGVLYAQFLSRNGRRAEAETQASQSVDLAVARNDRELLAGVGHGFLEASLFDASARAFKEIAALGPLTVEEALGAAGAHLGLGDTDEALHWLNDLIKAGAQDKRLYETAAAILKRKGDMLHLRNALSGLVRLEPQNAEYWAELADVCAEIGRSAEAAEAHDRLRSLVAATARDLAKGAGLWRLASNDARADELLTAATAGAETGDDHVAIAQVLSMAGQFDQAETHLRRALTLDPNDGAVLVELGRIKNGDLADGEVDALKSALAHSGLSPEGEAQLRFAIGDTHRARGAADDAMHAYDTANALLKASARDRGHWYDPMAEHTTAQQLIGFDYASPVEGLGEAPFTPIFITGLPQSDIAQIEAMLASHADVAAGGSAPAMQFCVKTLLREIEGERASPEAPDFHDAVRTWRELYFDALKVKHRAGARFVTDMQPLNFNAIGIIKLALPEAKIICVRSNPMASAFSIFRTPFTAALPFSFDLKDIAHFTAVYVRYMAHWEQAFPGGFIDVASEDLSANPEEEARRIASACGLGWDEALLHPEHAKHMIAPIYSVAARAPLAANDRDDAVLFGEHLGALREALTSAGVDLKTGKLAETESA